MKWLALGMHPDPKRRHVVYTELERGKPGRRAYLNVAASSTTAAPEATRNFGFDEDEADPLSEDATWFAPFALADGQGPKGTAWIPVVSVLAPRWEANRETTPGLSELTGPPW